MVAEQPIDITQEKATTLLYVYHNSRVRYDGGYPSDINMETFWPTHAIVADLSNSKEGQPVLHIWTHQTLTEWVDEVEKWLEHEIPIENNTDFRVLYEDDNLTEAVLENIPRGE